ncbi:MAG: DUF1292 domain-containing protein [Bacilli bacterium]|jgi:uncharacterized protein YrzB (UPF0473 family)|nr:DUF1292 domain-containing protein [Bacilli bacterium]
MEAKKTTFTVVDDEGKEIVCDVLFTFDSDETNKSYIVYTDNTKDEAGNTKVYASIYDPKVSNPKLEEITTDKEWKIIENILSTLQEEVKNQSEQ